MRKIPRNRVLLNGDVVSEWLETCTCHNRRGPAGGVCGNCGCAIPDDLYVSSATIDADGRNMRTHWSDVALYKGIDKDLFGNGSGAVFSDDRKYRYCLWRIWDTNKPMIMFIGLNPSNADEIRPDPTITRVKGFAQLWGYGGFYMMNLFGLVTSKPEKLLTCDDPVGDNDKWLKKMAKQCEKVIFCWGAFKQSGDRPLKVMGMFKGDALVINKDGTPRHPLYVKKDVIPIRMNY